MTPRIRRSMAEDEERGRYRGRDEWEDREWERDDRTPLYPGGFEDRYRDVSSRWHSQDYRPRGYGYGDGDRQPVHEARGHRGKGPAGYQRSDERIRESVCELLTEDDRVDATHIEVSVHGGEVMLAGMVEDRVQKRYAEDVVENVTGVKDVQNHLRVGGERERDRERAGDKKK